MRIPWALGQNVYEFRAMGQNVYEFYAMGQNVYEFYAMGQNVYEFYAMGQNVYEFKSVLKLILSFICYEILCVLVCHIISILFRRMLHEKG